MNENRVFELRGTELLTDTLRTFGSNFPAFFVMNIICLSPAALFLFYQFPKAVTQEDLFYNTLIYLGLQIFLGIIAQGAMVYGTVEYLAGHELNVGESLSRGFRSLALVIGVSVVSGLLVLMGLVLLIIPGIILALSLYVAVPVSVAENRGVMESLARSQQLMYGSRLQVFGALFLLNLLQRLINYPVESLVRPQGLIPYLVAIFLITTVFTAIQAIMAAVAYVRLRENVDSIDAEELSKIFR